MAPGRLLSATWLVAPCLILVLLSLLDASAASRLPLRRRRPNLTPSDDVSSAPLPHSPTQPSPQTPLSAQSLTPPAKPPTSAPPAKSPTSAPIAGPTGAQAPNPSPSVQISYLEPFADPLPIPPLARGVSSGRISITAFKTRQKFHRDLPLTWVYGYGHTKEEASSPGPSIVAVKGQKLVVDWGNGITDKEHLLPMDYSLNVPRPPRGGIPIVVHVHGAFVQSTSDGHPEAWFTSKGDVGPTFDTSTAVEVYQNNINTSDPASAASQGGEIFVHTSTYFNQQRGATIWYHDHTLAMTRLNVAAGLFGLYVVQDPVLEEQLRLPSGAKDIPLVIQDRSFDLKSGNLSYPSKGITEFHPVWVSEYWGDFIIVNGKVSPFLNVEPALYRLRLLNGANARFFTLRFVREARQVQQKTDSSKFINEPGTALNFSVIASDQGFLSKPISMDEVTLSPGERVEILIDFSKEPWGSSVILKNSAAAPFASGVTSNSINLQHAMKFSVKHNSKPNTQALDPAFSSLPQVQPLDPVNAAAVRFITMTEEQSSGAETPIVSLLEDLHWRDPVTVTPRWNSVEVWNIINVTPDWHPFHVHLVPHHILQRRPFNLRRFKQGKCFVEFSGMQFVNPDVETDENHSSGEVNADTHQMPSNISGAARGKPSCFTGPPEVFGGEELSWKDTTQVASGYVTTIILKFGADEGAEMPFDPTMGPGYVFHCHVLEHEDNDMMRPFVVLPPQDAQKHADRLRTSLVYALATACSVLFLHRHLFLVI